MAKEYVNIHPAVATGGAIVVLATGAYMLRPPILDISGSYFFADQTRKNIDQTSELLQDRYGVTVVMDDVTAAEYTAGIRSRALSIAEKSEALNVMLVPELLKYPPDFFRMAKIHRIRILKDANDVPLKVDSGTLYFNLHSNYDGTIFSDLHQDLSRHSLHYHIFQFAFFNNWSDERKARWIALNPHPEYAYMGLDNYRNLKESLPIWETIPHGGYATPLGRAAWDLDCGETAASVMLNQAGLLATVARRGDVVLLKKIDMVKTFYEELSGGLMNKRYFQDLLNGRVGTDNHYWKRNSIDRRLSGM